MAENGKCTFCRDELRLDESDSYFRADCGHVACLVCTERLGKRRAGTTCPHCGSRGFFRRDSDLQTSLSAPSHELLRADSDPGTDFAQPAPLTRQLSAPTASESRGHRSGMPSVERSPPVEVAMGQSRLKGASTRVALTTTDDDAVSSHLAAQQACGLAAGHRHDDVSLSASGGGLEEHDGLLAWNSNGRFGSARSGAMLGAGLHAIGPQAVTNARYTAPAASAPRFPPSSSSLPPLSLPTSAQSSEASVEGCPGGLLPIPEHRAQDGTGETTATDESGEELLAGSSFPCWEAESIPVSRVVADALGVTLPRLEQLEALANGGALPLWRQNDLGEAGTATTPQAVAQLHAASPSSSSSSSSSSSRLVSRSSIPPLNLAPLARARAAESRKRAGIFSVLARSGLQLRAEGDSLVFEGDLGLSASGTAAAAAAATGSGRSSNANGLSTDYDEPPLLRRGDASNRSSIESTRSAAGRASSTNSRRSLPVGVRVSVPGRLHALGMRAPSHLGRSVSGAALFGGRSSSGAVPASLSSTAASVGAGLTATASMGLQGLI